MADIFISYAHGDGSFVNKSLIPQLKQAGFAAWIDAEQLRAGKDWRQAIDDAIRSSFALVVIMSPKAKASEYVTYEWAFAWGAGVEVIPILLEKVDLHPRLEALYYLDFTDHWNLPWEKLTTQLKSLEENFEPPTQLIGSDLPSKIKGAIDLLNDETYFYTTNSFQIDNMYNNIAMLAASTHPVARKALMDVLEHPHRDARLAAINNLGNIQEDQAIDKIVLRLHDPEAEVRGTAAKALGRLGDGKATSDLLKSLKDDHAFVRSKAAEALGKIADERAVSALIKILSDPDYDVFKFALEALQRIGTPEALAAIEERRSETAQRAALAALNTLGKLSRSEQDEG